MRVIRSTGQNVSPSDDGRLYNEIFTDGLFTESTFTNIGGNNIQISAIYGDLCGRDFTIEQTVLAVTLPEGDTESTGYIYVEIDTSSDDVITLNSALAPFTPTYEDINTNGAVAQMILAEYTASAVAVQTVTPVYKIVSAGSVLPGSVATVETSPAKLNHSAGEYILYDGQLYKVTASISAGQSLTPGTNITATSAGSELTSLKNGLNKLGSAYTRLLNLTTQGRNSDTTNTLSESINSFRGLLFVVMNSSNFRVIGTSFVPTPVFSGGAAYVHGVNNLGGTDQYPVVFIHQSDTSVEVATNLPSTTTLASVICRIYGIK